MLTSVTVVFDRKIRNSSSRTAMMTTSHTLLLIHFPLIMRWASNFEQTADLVRGPDASPLIITQHQRMPTCSMTVRRVALHQAPVESFCFHAETRGAGSVNQSPGLTRSPAPPHRQ